MNYSIFNLNMRISYQNILDYSFNENFRFYYHTTEIQAKLDIKSNLLLFNYS